MNAIHCSVLQQYQNVSNAIIKFSIYIQKRILKDLLINWPYEAELVTFLLGK